MKKLKDFPTIVDKIIKALLLLLVALLIGEIIWVVSLHRSLFPLFPDQSFEQILVGQYTLAVTIILSISGLIGGGIIWMTTTFKHRLEEKYNEIEEIYSEIINRKKRIIGSLQNLTFSTRATWLFLVKQTGGKRTKTAGSSGQKKLLTQEELTKIFESAAFFESQTIRLFTAEDHKDVEAAAIFIFHRLHDEIGKKLLEDRLRLETSIENPDPKVIESLSRLLGAW